MTDTPSICPTALALVLTHCDQLVAGCWAGCGEFWKLHLTVQLLCALFQEDEFFDSGRQRGRHRSMSL